MSSGNPNPGNGGGWDIVDILDGGVWKGQVPLRFLLLMAERATGNAPVRPTLNQVVLEPEQRTIHRQRVVGTPCILPPPVRPIISEEKKMR